jgi:hypothetical protein
VSHTALHHEHRMRRTKIKAKLNRESRGKGGPHHQVGLAQLESWAEMMRQLPLNFLRAFGRP